MRRLTICLLHLYPLVLLVVLLLLVLLLVAIINIIIIIIIIIIISSSSIVRIIIIIVIIISSTLLSFQLLSPLGGLGAGRRRITRYTVTILILFIVYTISVYSI